MRISCFLFYCTLSLLASGCDRGGVQSTELEPAIEFSTSFRPVFDTKQFVSAMLSGSRFALEREPGDNPPQYAYLSFFPVLSAEDFEEKMRFGASYSRNRLPDLSHIDFSKNFVFLVAYPASDSYMAMTSGQQSFFMTKVKAAYPDNKVGLHLWARRLGSMDLATALSGSWEVELYVLERRERDQLEISLDDKTYRYSLNDADG